MKPKSIKDMKCPYCKKEARWCENKEIYGRNYGKSYMCYYCKDCNAYVGCHQNTKQPLGTMANKELRGWRIRTHAIIDPLWKSKKYRRKEVYIRLQDTLGKPVHVAEANIEECEEIIETVEKVFNLNENEKTNS